VAVSITSLSHTITDIEVTDQDDGTYLVEYVVTDATETYTIQVTTNGDVGNIKSSSVTASANIPDPESSTSTPVTPATVGASSSISLSL